MESFLILFLAVGMLVWLSTYGYILSLASMSLLRPHVEGGESSFPNIAVVIPTLNEEDLIVPKLSDLQRSNYPWDRIEVVVVDGGSTDRTTELVLQEITRGGAIRLEIVNGTRGRTDQIIHALNLLTQDIVVVTDVDSRLEPECIRKMVTMLKKDPQTAIVGATVFPNSALVEERLHWWFLNNLWWLEGEVLSSAGVSGICYACRREIALRAVRKAQSDNTRIPFAVSASGYRSRICRKAHTTELRVPQTANELVRFRRRRGAAYLSELRSAESAHSPPGWRLARLMRLWHFLVTPKLGVGLAAGAFVLLWSPYWPWPLLAFVVFAVPALVVLFTSNTLPGDRHRTGRLALAAIRLLALTLVSMLTLNIHPRHRDQVETEHD